ncbi:hypothetical protein M422DRAFT_36755 [Sphaerobolus stellatus SS14]|uniref:Uncharacterized protein n=1 Tax=Sphaerobolus stellatus (strain SS14) TaxID=990650 RepID=A0A0C9UY29_SPHS4|nr:hypothetical protein M422DRAFT_36755 [Sphaerobolus stellatus SS14]
MTVEVRRGPSCGFHVDRRRLLSIQRLSYLASGVPYWDPCRFILLFLLLLFESKHSLKASDSFHSIARSLTVLSELCQYRDISFKIPKLRDEDVHIINAMDYDKDRHCGSYQEIKRQEVPP